MVYSEEAECVIFKLNVMVFAWCLLLRIVFVVSEDVYNYFAQMLPEFRL